MNTHSRVPLHPHQVPVGVSHTLFTLTSDSTAQDELQQPAQLHRVRVLRHHGHVGQREGGDLLGQDLMVQTEESARRVSFTEVQPSNALTSL